MALSLPWRPGGAARSNCSGGAWGMDAQALYTPEVPGKRRLAISPNAMLVFEVEALPNE